MSDANYARVKQITAYLKDQHPRRPIDAKLRAALEETIADHQSNGCRNCVTVKMARNILDGKIAS